MKSKFIGLLITTLLMPLVFLAADTPSAAGTWSGSWTPKGGVMDAVTVEIREESGKLTGKFLSPAPMEFSKAVFDAKTGAVTLEATDAKSGKALKIAGKLSGNEIKGQLTSGDVSGDMLLIKWTFVPR